MRGYGQNCPISRGSEVFATRCTPIIVRNLLLGCTTFTALREGVPGISRTLLGQAIANGVITVDGSRDATRLLRGWTGLGAVTLAEVADRSR